MEVSTIEYYQVVRKIANGNEADAKILTDYVEQTKQTNYATLKDVFLTKDDKGEILKQISASEIGLMRYVDTKTEKQTRLILAVVGIGFTIMIILIGFMYNAINLLGKP